MFIDERGSIINNFNKPPFEIIQSFTSTNQKNTLRGIHFSPYDKFIIVTKGYIFDVIVSPDGTHKTYHLKLGDTLHVPSNHGHAFFCFEDSQVLYFLAGEYKNENDFNCHWKDPTLNIKWPEQTKHAIISQKDKNGNLFKPIETLILGSNGFLGKELLKYIPNSVGSTTRLCEIENELTFLKPKNVISAAGISGKPTIDWCEHNIQETIDTNITQQLRLIDICSKLGIHLTILGSGQIYDGDKYFTEEDEPNNYNSVYSRTRILLEKIINEGYKDKVLYLRVIYPMTCDGNEKCFMEKMKNRTNNVHDVEISSTIVPYMFPKINELMNNKINGIFNFSNKGSITLSNILNMINLKHTISLDAPNRGECKLNVNKLEYYLNDIQCIESYLKNMNK